jgi:hypothetical protein
MSGFIFPMPCRSPAAARHAVWHYRSLVATLSPTHRQPERKVFCFLVILFSKLV